MNGEMEIDREEINNQIKRRNWRRWIIKKKKERENAWTNERMKKKKDTESCDEEQDKEGARQEGRGREKTPGCWQIDRTELRNTYILGFPHEKPIDALERHE